MECGIKIKCKKKFTIQIFWGSHLGHTVLRLLKRFPNGSLLIPEKKLFRNLYISARDNNKMPDRKTDISKGFRLNFWYYASTSLTSSNLLD